MRVSCIQLNSGENFKVNSKKTINLILKSIKKDADLIITPEATSIISDDKKKLFSKCFSMKNDPFLKEVSLISKNFKKWIVVGSVFIRENNKLRNRSIVFNPKGKVEKFYDKISMFDVQLENGEFYKESKQFKQGKVLKLVNLPWGKLGLTICYDLRFPEIYRALSKKGAIFISVPSAFTKYTGKKHWLALLKARAIENFCFIFAPNQTGRNTKMRRTFGNSSIVSPDGKIIKRIEYNEGIILADIDPKEPAQLRKHIPSLQKKNFL